MKVLFISEKYIKENSEISDNVFGDFLLPAIRTSQEMYLQTILGTNLYNAIASKIYDGSISDSYKELLDDYIQPYLLERVITDLIPVISTKISNLGTFVNRDEYITTLTQDEIDRLSTFHQNKADFYCRRLQEYLLANRSSFAELDECACNNIKANLASAASTGLFLGGIRGYRLINKKPVSCH